jgi:xylulokinase
MFLSPVFRDAFVNTTGIHLDLFDTDGAQGAARAAGVGATIYSDYAEAFSGLSLIEELNPNTEKQKRYHEAYQQWLNALESNL